MTDAVDRTSGALVAIRVIHTLVWAFFVSIILAIPVAAWQRRFGLFLALSGIVMVEVAVLALNRFRCPLTDVAAKYTPDRRDNFDIYLPLALARYNKQIFGGLFVGGLLLGLIRFIVR
jgi:hypothetical protein